jgi:hypothetical protein
MRQKAVESPTGGLRQLPSFVVVSESALSPLVSLAYGGPREAPSEDGVSRSASAAIIAVLNRARSASIPTRIHPTQTDVIRQGLFRARTPAYSRRRERAGIRPNPSFHYKREIGFTAYCGHSALAASGAWQSEASTTLPTKLTQSGIENSCGAKTVTQSKRRRRGS